MLDWLRSAGHQAVDSYLPDSDTVRQSCLDDVAVCDLYVLIAGHRYGFQPDDENPGGLSITHLEFRRAGECGIPRVALLRTSIPDVSLSDLGKPPRLALVAGFRDEVAAQVRARTEWRGSCPQRTWRCWRPASASWPPSSAPPMAGIRWPGYTVRRPPARRRGCWCSTTRPTGPPWVCAPGRAGAAAGVLRPGGNPVAAAATTPRRPGRAVQ